MELDRKLNFVIPIERTHGTVYVHAQPIDRDVFEKYFLEISKTFAKLQYESLGIIAGPRTCGMLLKKISQELGTWEGAEGVQQGLFGEITRLCNFISRSPTGVETIPMQEAIDRKLLDQDEFSEVANALAFFIVQSAMLRRPVVQPMLEGACLLWGAAITLLNSTDFATSLKTSTAEENSGEKAKASLSPS